MTSLPQAKGACPATSTARIIKRIDVGESACDDEAGVLFVVGGDLFVHHFFGHGDGAAEIIGVGGAEARDFASGLRPGGGVSRVRVGYASDGRESFIGFDVSGEVG